MARTELEKLMALLKTDASVDPKPVRTGATSVRNKSGQKLDAFAANQQRPSSAPESRNTQPHTTGRINISTRPQSNRHRNGNARPQTNGPRNGNAHRSGRRDEHKTFDPKRQYVPDMKSIIRDFNGREILAPQNKIRLDEHGIIDFGADENKKYLNEDGSINFKGFNQTDLVRLLRRQIAMYLHDKNSTKKNVYKQTQLVRRYETRLKYVEQRSGRW